MALCRLPVYNNLTCHQYPIDQNFACQDYLEGKYIYASNKTLDKATLSVTFNGEITRLENLLNLQLQGDSSCLEYFKLLICYYFYPLCLSNYGSSVWSKKQKICSATCVSFRNDLCPGKVDLLAESIKSKFIKFDEKLNDGIKSILTDECSNNAIYDNRNSDKEKDCFFEKGKSTSLCFSLN